MKKFTCVGLSMVLALGLLAGCGGNDASTSEPDGSTPDASTSTPADASTTELSGSVATDGSTSMESVIGVLGEQFMADHPDVSVTYNPTGSGAGIEAVSNGSCDIGLASRALKDEEKAGGLTETIVALDGIAVIVNAENSVTDLTRCVFPGTVLQFLYNRKSIIQDFMFLNTVNTDNGTDTTGIVFKTILIEG